MIMSNDSKKVGIVIPTKDRVDFIVRQLNYYANVDSPHAVYIGDSSSQENSQILQNKIKQLSDQLEVHYFHWPDFNDRQAIYNLACQVKEDYVSFTGDDDFLIPASLTRCANFLSEDSCYRTAQGKALLFSLSGDPISGEIKFSSPYWLKKEILSDSALDRLSEFSRSYWVPQFSVHRTKEFIDDMRNYSSIPDRGFGELINCFMIACNGKSKFIDCLFLIRQGHEFRGGLPSGQDWSSSEEYKQSHTIFIDTLAEELCKHEKMELSVAKKWIRENFEACLEKGKIKRAKQTSCATAILQFVKFKIKKLNMLGRMVSFIRYNWLCPMNHVVLSKKSNPYFHDFLSIARFLKEYSK